MPKIKKEDDKKHRGQKGPLSERTGERSSPGSGEDGDEAADLQPEDVETSDTAR